MGALILTREPHQRAVLFDTEGREIGNISASYGQGRYIRIRFELPEGIRIVREELLERREDA